MAWRTRTVRRCRVTLETLESRLAPSVTQLIPDGVLFDLDTAVEAVTADELPAEVFILQEVPVEPPPESEAAALFIPTEVNEAMTPPETPAVEHLDRAFEDLGAVGRGLLAGLADAPLPEREAMLPVPRFFAGPVLFEQTSNLERRPQDTSLFGPPGVGSLEEFAAEPHALELAGNTPEETLPAPATSEPAVLRAPWSIRPSASEPISDPISPPANGGDDGPIWPTPAEAGPPEMRLDPDRAQPIQHGPAMSWTACLSALALPGWRLSGKRKASPGASRPGVARLRWNRKTLTPGFALRW